MREPTCLWEFEKDLKRTGLFLKCWVYLARFSGASAEDLLLEIRLLGEQSIFTHLTFQTESFLRVCCSMTSNRKGNNSSPGYLVSA